MFFRDHQNKAFKSQAPSTEMMSLLEHSDRSVIILDADYRILWFNMKASREMYAFFEEELKTGSSYWDYVFLHKNVLHRGFRSIFAVESINKVNHWNHLCWKEI